MSSWTSCSRAGCPGDILHGGGGGGGDILPSDTVIITDTTAVDASVILVMCIESTNIFVLIYDLASMITYMHACLTWTNAQPDIDNNLALR